MGKKIVDLTMLINSKTPSWPGDEKQEIKPVATFEKDEFNVKRVTFNSHFGTHLDAPFHVTKNGKRLGDFPMETFFGSAIVIPLNEFSKYSKEIKPNDIVLLTTGQSNKAFSGEYYKDSPVISIEIAEELVRKKIKMVGIDFASVDTAPWKVHDAFLKNNILIIENLINLDKLAGKRIEFIVLPLKLDDADGAPCRAVAIVE